MHGLMSALRTDLQADPPTAAKPFRRIEEGQGTSSEYVRPFMTVRLVETEAVSTTDGDKVLQAALVMRLVTDVVSDDPHDAILDAIGAVEDYFDSLFASGSGIVDGADGFDDRSWTLTYPAGSTGVQTAEASCEQTFIVKIERGYNRVPKP
jgi:hypothetical protein